MMRKEFIVPVMLAILGLIFLVGGVSAYFSKARVTLVCEACGMELETGEQLPLQCHTIVCGDGSTHYACCPICALAMAYYYNDATVSVPCFTCAQEINITVEDGNLSSVTPSTACVIFGAACVRNKMICCQDCAESAKQNYDWAADLPVITTEETFSKGKMMAGTKFDIAPKTIKIPTITYALIAAGIVLLASAPLSWGIMTGKIHKKA